MGDRPAAGKRSMAEWLWDGLAIRPTLNLPLTVAYSGLHAACARGPTLTRSASEVEPPLPSLALRVISASLLSCVQLMSKPL